ASQLTGLPEAARRILARNVRIGRPLGVSGLPDAAKGPAFSTAVGLMIYPQVADLETHAAGSGMFSTLGGNSRFARMGQWLKESF
ncbi:cell division protein FtsA, partial [Sinorhizobium meliloti]